MYRKYFAFFVGFIIFINGCGKEDDIKKSFYKTWGGVLIDSTHTGMILTTFDNWDQKLKCYYSYDGLNFLEFSTPNLENEKVRDPDLIMKDNVFYISITGKSIRIFKTYDFKTFSLHSNINPEILGKTNYWAPEIFADDDGNYFLIFAGYEKYNNSNGYIVSQYIAPLNDRFDSFSALPSKLKFPDVDEFYHFDTSICKHGGNYYSACFGNKLTIYESPNLFGNYKVKLSVPLQGCGEVPYFEGPSIIFANNLFLIYVTQTYIGWSNSQNKGIGVYIFSKDWQYIGFEWCQNVSASGTRNIMLGEHPKLLKIPHTTIDYITKQTEVQGMREQ